MELKICTVGVILQELILMASLPVGAVEPGQIRYTSYSWWLAQLLHHGMPESIVS